MKLAIVVDSSCGLTQKQANDRGWFFLPLYIEIDGKEYADGIDLTSETFSQIYKENSSTKTSCTPPGEALKLFEELSKEYDFVVVYPISQFLSSQYQNLEVLAKNFKNIIVIKSKNVAQLIVKDLVEFETKVKSNDLTVKQAVKEIEERKYVYPNILLYPKNMNALVKGGRLSPSAAKLAKLLKIVPIIAFDNGKLEKYDKGRVFSQTVINKTVDLYNKLSAKNKDKNLAYMFLDVLNNEADLLFSEIKKNSNYNKKSFRFSIPSVIAIHTGYESVAIFMSDLELPIENYGFNDNLK